MRRISWIGAIMQIALAVVLSTTPSASNGFLWAQDESDAAQSIGVGLKSRFASGATPIEIERTSIIPGTPMTVTSTMSKMIPANGGNSFGGILGRYDTSTFGKFFGTTTLNPRAATSLVQSLEGLEQGDNEVENETAGTMYPPRLVLDFTAYPMRSLSSIESRSTIAVQIDNAISRFEFDKNVESVRAECEGTTVFLRGKVKTERLARLVESVVGLQAGVERVVNELVVLEPTAKSVDLFGKPTF